MNIAFGHEIFLPESNGIVTATFDQAKHLIELGHNVYFFVPENKELTEDIIDGIHIIQVRAPKGFLYRGMRTIRKRDKTIYNGFKDNNIDIVVGLSPWKMGLACNYSAEKLNIPAVGIHHTLIDNPEYIQYVAPSKHIQKLFSKWAWPLILKPYYKKTWVITAPAHGTCQQIKDHLPNADVRYISNGTDIEKFSKPKSADISDKIPNEWIGKNTLIYVGRLGLEKAIDKTITAFKIAADSNPNLKLIIVGSGPFESKMKEIIKRDKLHDKILLTGMIQNDDIINSKVLSQCAAFVTASVSENQSMTVIEALCSNLPVICANVPNMSDLVDDTKGWLFEPNNPEDMARCMLEATSNVELRDKKAVNAGNSKVNYEGMKITKEFVNLYEEMIEKKKSGFTAKDIKL